MEDSYAKNPLSFDRTSCHLTLVLLTKPTIFVASTLIKDSSDTLFINPNYLQNTWPAKWEIGLTLFEKVWIIHEYGDQLA